MKYLSALIFFILFGLISCSTFEVIPVTNEEALEKKQGLFYHLPRTVLSIDITVSKTDHIKGPFAAYSAKYLGISNVINENSSNYSIDDISISTYAEPDPEKVYFISIPKKFKKTDKLQFLLEENGVISGFNSADDSVRQNNTSALVRSNHEEYDAANASFKYFATQNILEKTDTIFEKIILDTMTIEKQILQHSLVEKSMEQKASDVADYLSLIAENKMNLLSGYQEVPYSLETIAFMLEKLEQMEQDYLALFTGKTVSSTLTYHFEYVPNASTKSSSLFLFSFDKKNGLSEIADPENEENSVFIELMPSMTTTRLLPIVKMHASQKVKKGFYYNIPEKTKVFLNMQNGEILYEANLQISQFGITSFLPVNIRKVRLFPRTGAIERID